jgi:hypothetical protein
MTRQKQTITFLSLILILALSIPMGVAADDDFSYLRETFLNQDPDPAEPGELLELRWKVEKYGLESINDVEYKLVIDYPFSFEPSNDAYQELGNWWVLSDKEEYQTLFYKLRVDENAIEDEYDIKLLSRYDEQPEWTTKEYTIRVGEPKRPNFVVGNLQTSPTKLTADTDEAKLSVDLQNIGKENADVVIASVSLPEGFEASYGYSDRATLGTVSAGMGKTANFFVDVDENVRSGVHNATLTIKYKEDADANDEYKTVDIPLEIPIKRKPRFMITDLSLAPETIRAGDSGAISFALENSGEKDATSVSVKLYKESSQPFDFNEKTSFVGTLEPGDSGEAQLSFSVDNDAAAKDYIFDIEIRSVDGDQVVIQEETVTVAIENGEQGLGSVGVVIFVAVLVGAGYLYYTKRFKRKR